MNIEPQHIKKVSIVGAGPGDPELLTVRALNRIKNADVILHDNLVPLAILDLSSPTTEKIYVGRKFADAQDQSDRQQNINELMRDYALKGKNVVRLKSGDSFIFGRVIEEIRYLQEHSIPFEIVPGITAGIAAANLQQIPLTERNRSNSVLFCTGHTANYDFEQLEALANMLKTGTTLIMYMGFKNLKEVINKLKEFNKTETLYLSAISKVSQPDQSITTGSLNEIEQKLEKEQLPMPVVFIVGKYAFPINQESLLMITENEQ
jgi:uroporphyrin-III C-methyltransferase